ncbi:cysteine proteinase [Backusella circina FSU 941]|nr:cysteine proteinase [Backusella circina FSU 941]
MGIPQLMMYIRPQAYYDDLAKQLAESELAKLPQGADICLASAVEAEDDSAYVSGLVNTGNTCFMNSMLQALSSLPELHLHLEYISNVASGVPLPVTRSLLKTMRTLTKPILKRSSFRPIDIVTALSSNRRIISREQQDAQEFFQLVSSAIDIESQEVQRTELLGGGLKDLLNRKGGKIIAGEEGQKALPSDHIENPFTGLLANRLSCMQCGYTGAIRHFTFNNIQLNVPNKYTATLDECLSQFTSMEYLQDASCRKCSFEATQKALSTEINQLKELTKKTRESTKKKRKSLVTHMVALERAKQELEERVRLGRMEEEHDQDKVLLRPVGRMSSKQVMLAKPPKILCLHISRSAFLNTGAIYKNTCQLLFPEYLDISPFSTNGTLHTRPNVPISIPEGEEAPMRQRYYKLMSVVVHYGSHSFGHFVAFKRRIYADQCQCHQCRGSRPCCDEEWKDQNSWYRISDTKVDECSLEYVLKSNPYMLLYQLVDEDEYTIIESEEETDESLQEEMKQEDHQKEDKEDVFETATSEATREALRIANSLLIGDKGTELLAATEWRNEEANPLTIY